jgi:aspartate aminotransferase
MSTLSARTAALSESAIRKLDALVAARSEVSFYRVNIGQPDVATPAPMLQAIQDFQAKVLRYGPASGLPACREAAARYHSAWSKQLGPEHVAVTTGGSEALIYAFAVACDPGDEILAPEPFYTNYQGFACTVGAKIVPVPTTIEDGFALPSDEVLAASLTERTRAVVFANPGNPTGAVYPREDLERLTAFCAEHKLLIISDEVYRRIYFGSPPASILEIAEARERSICVDSMSKTWSACGLRLGFLISHNLQIMQAVERLGQSRLGPQPLAQAAAIAALELGPEHYIQTRALYKERIDTLLHALDGIPGVSVHRPAGAFYLMVQLPVADTEAFARFMVQDFSDQGESIVVAPGGGFFTDPERGKHLIRLAAVLEPDKLRRAAELLKLGLQAYRAKIG